MRALSLCLARTALTSRLCRPGIRSSWLSLAPYVAILTWFTLVLSVWTFLVSFRSGCTRCLPGKWLDGLPWTVLVRAHSQIPAYFHLSDGLLNAPQAFGVACGVLWFWAGTGRGVDIWFVSAFRPRARESRLPFPLP